MTHTEQKCCEKCETNIVTDFDAIKGCSNPSCPCHQQKCKSSPFCSHNTNGRDMSKPCSIELSTHQVVTDGTKSRAELVEEIVGEFMLLNSQFDPAMDYVIRMNVMSDFLRSALLRISDASLDAVEVEEQENTNDLIDETLADIAADTKGEAWVLGWNAAGTEQLQKRTLFIK